MPEQPEPTPGQPVEPVDEQAAQQQAAQQQAAQQHEQQTQPDQERAEQPTVQQPQPGAVPPLPTPGQQLPPLPPGAVWLSQLPASNQSRFGPAARRFVGHRATQLVAVLIAGLLIGGGAVALADHHDGSGPVGYHRQVPPNGPGQGRGGWYGQLPGQGSGT